MKITWKNVIRAVILLCLLICLSACGRDKDIGEKNHATVSNSEEMVYVPQFYSAKLDAAYVNTGCVIGRDVYLIGAVDQTDSTLDPNTGETNFIYRSGCALFRAPINSSEYERWEGYRPFDFLNGASGYVFSDGIYPGKDETLWISTYVSLPDSPQTKFLQKFDLAGNERARIDLSALSEDIKVSDIISTVVDRADNLYICTMDQIFVFDSGQKHLFTLKTNEKVDWDESLILLGDGQVGLRSSRGGLSAEGANDTLQTVDAAKRECGASYPLPAGSRKIYLGSGEYLL